MGKYIWENFAVLSNQCLRSSKHPGQYSNLNFNIREQARFKAIKLEIFVVLLLEQLG
jgi:hypothetical protein